MTQVIKGARFAKSFFRPTAMSVALADAGIIPAPHLIQDQKIRLTVRNRNDNFNIRPSISLSL
jgi:hypothetical protein